MQFANAPVFLLLLLIPLLHRWWMKKNRPPSIKFPVSIPKGVKKGSPVRRLLILRYIALALMVTALARPQTVEKQVERKVSGIDIILVTDVSRSMLAEDLGDRNRLEIAKDTLTQFVMGRKNDRIGYVLFSGEPLTLVPPTLDYGLLLNQIRKTEIGLLRDGTAIGDGLSLAVNRLRNSTAKSRIIVLLTDGKNNIGQVDPETAGSLAAGYGIKVYTIAIGSRGSIRLPIKHTDPLGRTVTTYQRMGGQLDTKLLKKIADITQAKFYRVTSKKIFEKVFKEIDQLEKSEVKSFERVRYQEEYEKPLKLAFLFLIIEQILALGWWRFFA